MRVNGDNNRIIGIMKKGKRGVRILRRESGGKGGSG
jgi:hypothetical protein